MVLYVSGSELVQYGLESKRFEFGDVNGKSVLKTVLLLFYNA